jgi:translation initiation factor IF-3
LTKNAGRANKVILIVTPYRYRAELKAEELRLRQRQWRHVYELRQMYGMTDFEYILEKDWGFIEDADEILECLTIRGEEYNG